MELLDDPLEEIDLTKIAFRGKLSAKKWQYIQTLDNLKRTKVIILLMGGVLLYPVLIIFMVEGTVNPALAIERLCMAGILVACYFFFNRFRLLAISFGILIAGLILWIYLSSLIYFSIWRFGINAAMFLLILAGYYFHFREKRLKSELMDAWRNGATAPSKD
ncbi:MAG: hypothetical protein AAF990_14760 [Bacteroidota bacterium]